MKDIIEKSIYLGLGIASTTKKKVENLVNDLIAKGQLEKKDKSKVIKELLEKVEKSEPEFKKKTIAIVNETIHNLKLATQKEVKELKRNISDLQKKINTKIK